MGIRSDAHFGVKEQVLDAVITRVQQALEGFSAAQFGVSEVRVERRGGDSFVITFTMASTDPEQADADAETAVEAVKDILNEHFERGDVRERQRVLALTHGLPDQVLPGHIRETGGYTVPVHRLHGVREPARLNETRTGT